MSQNPGYHLVFYVLFSTEKDLEKGIATFNAWCKTQEGPHKKYGFVRTGQILGELFLSSPSPALPNPQTIPLRSALIADQISIYDTTCQII